MRKSWVIFDKFSQSPESRNCFAFNSARIYRKGEYLVEVITIFGHGVSNF
jgi:hypothetical protein